MKRFYAAALILLFPALVLAWGQTGHRAIAAIAQEHLSREALNEIDFILNGRSLVMMSTYMDEVRSDDAYDHTHDWHWVTIPDGMRYEDTDKNPNGDLLEAIERMKALASNEDTNRAVRAEALAFLVHLIGDLHQPLHVGNGKDRGGNDVQVKWFGRRSNLHRVWDSGMIDSRDFSYSELSYELNRMIKPDQIDQWSQGNPVSWAHETLNYREDVYNVREPNRMGYEYTYRNWSLLEQQLMKAGIRLAATLNEIFD